MKQRELKFRAFDDGKMLTMPLDTNFGISRFFGILREDAIVMQFTGIKDIADKEIYEGDILEFKNELGRHHKYTVFSVDGGLAINTHKSDFGKETQFYDACADMQTSQWIKQCAVIGNIYQNADLLQDVV